MGVLIRFAFAVVSGSLASLNAQDLDSQFNPNVGGGSVETIALQADGKVLIGGEFTSVGGVARSRIARLNTNGTLDLSFNPNANDIVDTIVVRSDATILVGGSFTRIGGQTRNRFARLFSNGSLDAAFNPDAGTNSSIRIMRIQDDGRVLLGGWFSSISGQVRNNLARLTFSGTLDATFNPNANDAVFALETEPDGQILIGGAFDMVAGQARNRLARLNANGSLDLSFDSSANGPVSAIEVLEGGKILIAGEFTSIGGQAAPHLARLHPDGSLDTSFNPNVNAWVRSITVQSDGKILIGGAFTSIGGQPRSRIARLDQDGELDVGFDVVASGMVNAVREQSDGGVVFGGFFTVVEGEQRNRIARLLPPTSGRTIRLLGDLSFGRLEAGQTATRTLRILNTGNLPLNVTNINYPLGFSGNWPGGIIVAGGEQTVTVTFSPASPQIYSGTVTVASDATEGANSLAISGEGEAAAGGDDHGDDEASATTINPNSMTSGILESAGDRDYFRIFVGQTGVLTVLTAGSTDTFGHLLDAVGNEIAFGDSGGSGGNFRIVRTVTPGIYFLRIGQSSGIGPGYYELHSSLLPAEGVDPPARPSGVAARQVGKNSILVRWRAVPRIGGDIGYVVENRRTGWPWRKRMARRTTFLHRGVRAKTRYSYRVMAVDRSTGTTSRPSRTVSVRTKPSRRR